MDSGYPFDIHLQRLSLNRFRLRDRVIGQQSGDDQDKRIQADWRKTEPWWVLVQLQKTMAARSVQHIALLRRQRIRAMRAILHVAKNLSENAQASLRTIRWIMAILIQGSLVRGLIS